MNVKIPGNITPHSCSYCDKIVITCSDSTFPSSDFSFSFDEVWQAANDGCRLFYLRLRRFAKDWAEYSYSRVRDSLSLRVSCSSCDKGPDPYSLVFYWYDGEERLFQKSSGEDEDYLEAFVSNDNPAAPYIEVKALNPEPASEETFRSIRSWLRNCREKHEICEKLRFSLRHQATPTRLLEVGEEGNTKIRLRSTNKMKALDYAALSYCWGGDQESKTTRANLEERLEWWSLKSLPKTIRDAVKTTRRLGLKYLWIDALCIVQNDRQEMERELAIMSQIYSGASITIAAARAHNVNEGFLQRRDLEQLYEAVHKVPYCLTLKGERNVWSVCLSERRLDVTYDDPLDSRAWTLQEQLRSLQRLRFDSKHTVWECAEGSHVDGGTGFWTSSNSEYSFTGTLDDKPYPYSIEDSAYGYLLDSMLTDWQDILSQYSTRSLTKISDRLPAFAAIAEAFAKVMHLQPDGYCAGLWRFDIRTQLCWRRPKDVPKSEWCMERTVPSWSWASLQGPIIFDEPHLSWGGDTLQVNWEKLKIGLKSPDVKYGEVEYARLVVKGYMRQAYWTGEIFVAAKAYRGKRAHRLPIDGTWDLYEEKPQDIWFLEINPDKGGTSCGLLLTTVDDSTFKRVGYFDIDRSHIPPKPVREPLAGQISSSNAEWFYNWELRIIVIE